MSLIRKRSKILFQNKRATLEAFFCLLAVWIAQRLFPFKLLIRNLGTYGFETENSVVSVETETEIMHIVSGMAVISAILPVLKNCLTQSIAAKIMLNRRCIASTLYIGVATFRHGGQLKVGGHAWVRCGRTIIGSAGSGLVEIFKIGTQIP